MIEVTDEMLKVARSMQSFELMIKRIIELHEQSKPKPEAVGYIYNHSDGNTYFAENKNKLMMFVLMDSGLSKEMLIGELMDAHSMPLYTTPPTQEPLSEEQIEKLVPWQGDSKDPFFNRIKFARAIEQAHGIT